jgi:hypothetical protein
MRLLDLGGDRASLEFATAEWPIVRAGLARLGTVSVLHEPTYDLLRIQGETLLSMNEWDEPCLIAETQAGIAILEALAGDRIDQVAAE